MPTKVDREVEQGWGPSVEGRRRRLRPLKWLVFLVLVLVVFVAGFGWWATTQVPRIEVGHLAASGRPMHILIAGSDSREGLSDDERRELSTGSTDGDRTDTILLLTLDGSDAALLSFPRDLWVTRCDGSVGRINVATSLGGPSCLVETVRDLSGIPVQHYVEVTFAGFRDLVDAVGGVELCLPDPIADRDAGIDLPAGCQTLDGADALGFVRVRKIDDDLGRVGRQQQFVRALAREVATPSTVLHPGRLVGLVRESGDAVAVDEQMGVGSFLRFANGIRGLAGGDTITSTVPAHPMTTSAGAMVLEVDEVPAAELFAAHRDGTVFDRDGDRPEEVQLQPSDVEVAVHNGANVAGLAASVGELLTGRGFVVVDVGNADARDTTVVRYPPGEEAAARLVADNLTAGGNLEESSEVTTITVVLGRDAVGV